MSWVQTPSLMGWVCLSWRSPSDQNPTGINRRGPALSRMVFEDQGTMATAGMSRTLLMVSPPLSPFFLSVSIIVSCFSTIKTTCWLSLLSRFSTDCPQVIVLLNLCKNFKLRYHNLTSPLVDYLSVHRSVIAINSSAQIVALPLN